MLTVASYDGGSETPPANRAKASSMKIQASKIFMWENMLSCRMVARHECAFQELHDGRNAILIARAPFVEK
jgi:hypothetical protein